ncbi:MAG: hypothetical protein WD929_04850 [Steroidobacteraceae bacterium]
MHARQSLGPSALEREINRFEGDLRAAARRLQDLVRCGQTQEQVRHIAELTRTAGFLPDEPQLQHHGGAHLVGWRLRLVRQGGIAT